MGRIVFVTGGCRSGKSSYAQSLAEGIAESRLYIATCPVIDPEITERVRLHQLEREKKNWDTVEEEIDLAGAIGRAEGYGVVLVDCLTLWLNNLMYSKEKQNQQLDEAEVCQLLPEIFQVCRGISATTVFVSNEVGMGIVPENALSRRFRDVAGRCNQLMAREANEAVLISCGIPIVLKK